MHDELTPQSMEKLKSALVFNLIDNRNSLHSKFYDNDDDLGSKYYKLGKSAQNIFRDHNRQFQKDLSPTGGENFIDAAIEGAK